MPVNDKGEYGFPLPYSKLADKLHAAQLNKGVTFPESNPWPKRILYRADGALCCAFEGPNGKLGAFTVVDGEWVDESEEMILPGKRMSALELLACAGTLNDPSTYSGVP